VGYFNIYSFDVGAAVDIKNKSMKYAKRIKLYFSIR